MKYLRGGVLILSVFSEVLSAVPLNLHSQDETNTTVELQWVPSGGSGVTSQSVKKQTGFTFETIATVDPGTSEYNVTGLSPYSSYTFKVCEYNAAAGSSECSLPVSVVTTHTWQSPLYDCLGIADTVPRRTQLLQISQFFCSSAGLTEIEPIRDLKNLQILNIAGNSLSVTFPGWIGELNQLTYVNIAENNFTGSLSSTIGNLTALQTLNCSENNLSGPLPETIGNLGALEILDLHNNLISGSIPESIGTLHSLTGLDLSGNDLSGPLPESIGNLSLLQQLVLKHNRLDGALPDSIGNLTNLSLLSAFVNQFTGTLPASIGNLANLRVIDLTHNHFYGSLPASIGQLSLLDTLSIGYNDLSGKIPTDINATNMPNLDDGTGIQLIGNCALYADGESIPFINQKSSGLGAYSGYSGIINTNTQHCFIPATVPVNMFLLQ